MPDSPLEETHSTMSNCSGVGAGGRAKQSQAELNLRRPLKDRDAAPVCSDLQEGERFAVHTSAKVSLLWRQSCKEGLTSRPTDPFNMTRNS